MFKFSFSNYHSLEKRFRAALVGAFVIGTPLSEVAEYEKLMNDIVESVIAEVTDCPINQPQIFYAIAIGLYWHQDLARLPYYLKDSESLTIGLAIAWGCRNELHPRTLISQLTEYISLYIAKSEESQDLIAQLRLVQSLVDKGESHSIASTLMDKDSLAYSIYCFLSTPHNFHLATYDLGRFQAGIGAIAAVYQGYVPIDNLDIVAIGSRLGGQLLAAWAGGYQAIPSGVAPALTAPDVLKRRH